MNGGPSTPEPREEGGLANGDPAGERLVVRVPAAERGNRLDRYLTDCLGDRTRSAVRRMILEGRVTVNGRAAAKPGFELEPGMRIEVAIPEKTATRPRAEAIPLTAVYEDDHLLALDKPAGLVVHPGHGRREGTLVNALLGRGTPLASTGAPDRPGIVHRLDQGTSGLIVVAKNDAAHHALAAAFSRREIEKRYVALVWGRVDPEQGTIRRSIGRSPTNRVKMSVRGGRGRDAVTHYRTRESLPGFSFLDVRPETGRTHQIRVHLQSIHHPIVGDTRYGGRPWKGVADPRKRKALRELDRLALHASELCFAHPLTGRELRLSAQIPEELEALLRTLRQPSR